MYVVRCLIKSNAWESLSSCPTYLQKLQNNILRVLWYFCSKWHSCGLCPHFLHIPHYPPPSSGFGAPTATYYTKAKNSSFWWPLVLHLMHHTCSHFSFPFVISTNWIANATSWFYICAILLFSPTREASNFIAISNASDCDITIFYMKGLWMWGKNLAMNHSLCCWLGIWNVHLSITSLNLWSNSHTNTVYTSLIALSSVMYYDSDFGFLNSCNNASVISFNVLVYQSFMYQTSACPLKVVSNCTIFAPSSWTFFAVHMVSHTNICCYGSSHPIPLNSRNLSVLSTPAILLCVGPIPGVLVDSD